MIEKDEFLQRRRIEFAIGAKFERHFRHPIRLPRGVDAESVRFALGDADNAVVKGREQKG